MNEDLTSRLQTIRNQVHAHYHSVVGAIAALENAVSELLKLHAESPDADISFLLAEAREKRAILLEKTSGLGTASSLSEWEYVISRLEWLVRNGYYTINDAKFGGTRSTVEILMEAKHQAQEWSREKACIYMIRARDLLPVAPLAAINYLEKAQTFPELPPDIALDLEDLRSAATELLGNQMQGATPMRFSALIRLVNNKVDALTQTQTSTQQQLDQLRAEVITHIAGLELSMTQIVNTLNQRNLESLRLVVKALDEGKLARDECVIILEAIHRMIRTIKLKSENPPQIISTVDKYISGAELEAGHKLKITIPIVPFILEYEGELQLGSDVDLRKLWESIIKKVSSDKTAG